MYRAAVTTFALTALGACTHEKPMSSISGAVGGDLVVETTSHGRVHAGAYPAKGGVQIMTLEQVPIPPAEIVKITDINRGRGALEGGGIGALAGIVVGAAVGAADGDDACHDYCILDLSAGDKALIYGFMFGSLGGISGLLVGALVGSRDVYTFNAGASVPRITPSGPPGSTVGMTVRW